jgi:hypothetical protein
MAIGRVRSAGEGSPREARFKKQRRSRRAEIRPPDRDGGASINVDAARATINAEETGRVAGVDRMHAADETRARH